MFVGTEQLVLSRQRTRGRLARLEQSEPLFDAQYAGNRIVEPRHRDRPVARLGQRTVVEAAPAVGRHEHVDPGVDCLGATGVAAACHLAVRVPVGDHQAAEIHAPLQNVGHQPAVPRKLDAVPAREAGHHGGNPVFHCRQIGRAMDQPQLDFGNGGIALVLAVGGGAIGKEVLGAGGDVRARKDRLGRWRSLQAADHAADIRGNQRGVRGIAFIGAAPAVILRHRDGRGEGPFLPGDADLDRSNLPDPLDQIGIARRAEPDIVRKDRRADDIAMAVHCIGAPDDRNRGFARCGIHRSGIEGVRQRQPFFRRGKVIAARSRIAAVEHRSEPVFANLFRSHAGDIGLDDLTDLLLQRHLSEQRLNMRFAFFGQDRGKGDFGPLLRVDDGFRCRSRYRFVRRRLGRQCRHCERRRGGARKDCFRKHKPRPIIRLWPVHSRPGRL